MAAIDAKEVENAVDLTDGKKLCFKEILREGEGDERPGVGDTVTVHYTGTLLDGTKFDSSVDRGEYFTFVLGKGRVIKGWDTGVATMRRGEKAMLTCAPSYAYGARGAPPKIPANATLKFEVELFGWKSEHDLTDDGGVRKVTIAPGNGWQKPHEQYEVVVEGSIHAAPEEGSPDLAAFGPITFTVGAEGAQGLSVAVQEMKKNETAWVSLSAAYLPAEDGPTAPLAAAIAAHPAAPGAQFAAHLKLTLVTMRRVEDISAAKDGSVTIKMLTDAGTQQRANEGATCTVAYAVTNSQGVCVAEATATFDVGDGTETVPAAVEEAVRRLVEGQQCEVTVAETAAPLMLAGVDGLTPGAATLSVTLQEATREVPKSQLAFGELCERALKRKEEGNRFFGRGLYDSALKKYTKGADLIKDQEEVEGDDEVARDEILLTCYLNAAASAIQLGEFRAAISHCDAALAIDASSVKGLFRRGQALLKSNEFEPAIADFAAILEVDPDNAPAASLLKRAKKRLAKQTQKDKAVYGRMFG